MTTVHRLLDEAFAGIPLTPEAADLKEEIRAGLLDRVAELEAGGLGPDEAAHRAVAELGDVHALIAEVSDGAAPPADSPAPGGAHRPHWADAAALRAAHRVRPRPAYVIGVTLAGVVAAAAVATLALVVVGALDSPGVAATVLLAGVGGLAAGWIVGATLRQETTSNHPMPIRRAVGYGVAGGLVVAGAALAATAATSGDTATGWLLTGLALVVLGGLGLTWLGVTQTNRRKAWARSAGHGDTRFDTDPAAAARFGIYTAVIWVTAFALFTVLGFAWSWAWSWIALVAGWAVMMLLLAHMLFGSRDTPQR
ncbi:hypothetical protein ET495_06525 [Xylanimonas allomyrinae]|uniref:Uncharacterized protein n=1 Tax=Xylanimonas allomyrinae TaxID=2509459 RepID=A0A4P6EMH5_9MICO|nr:permease prefix domain 1-containing protein [Xylanimonas allomyrinae]QAY62953.1 hypothetical protein ET495_06525 [Xylanimonas allomyrinae]